MLRTIVAGIGLLVAALLVAILVQPEEFRIQRSALISAPPAVPFAAVNDLRLWSGWSPWESRDRDMERQYSGPQAGVGATYRWSGDDSIGEGRMTITDSKPGEQIGIELEFFRPLAATNRVTFLFTPEGGATRVTWSMQGENSFVGKAISLVMDMDEMVGNDFEAGLAALKDLSER
jgi:hypothetical protein